MYSIINHFTFNLISNKINFARWNHLKLIFVTTKLTRNMYWYKLHDGVYSINCIYIFWTKVQELRNTINPTFLRASPNFMSHYNLDNNQKQTHGIKQLSPTRFQDQPTLNSCLLANSYLRISSPLMYLLVLILANLCSLNSFLNKTW